MKIFKEINRIGMKKNLINIPGWRTNRKIVVIESDDWGMVRMVSKDTYDWFLQNGYRVDLCPYNRNDSIESNEDLESLLEVLSSVRDCFGNGAVMTVNNIVANPDFEKIRDSGYSAYFYEPFTDTLKRYPGRDRVYELYREGIDRNLLRPQFHGREHLNINRWMEGLNSGNGVLLDAFVKCMYTVTKDGAVNSQGDNLDAFGLNYSREWENVKNIVESGLNLFESLWGYRSKSFIAPCYIWPEKLERMLSDSGVGYIQGTHLQMVPPAGNKSRFRKKYHYQGQKNRSGQRYLIRNVHFEPVECREDYSINKALKDIEIAFRNKKPAIISSHRVNYMGSIRPENRSRNLKLLRTMLRSIVEKFPDIEFMSSDRLGELITQEK